MPRVSTPLTGKDGVPRTDPTDKAPILIPREKFVIPTHKPRNGDPRGTSHLRATYPSWWKKQMIHPQHLAYVTRFAQPSIVADIDKEAKDIPIKDESGKITGYKSIVTATNDALVKVKGGATGAFVGTKVAMLEARSDGKVVFDSYSHEDRQIAKGMLLQTLTTEEAEHMARAASTVHQDIFGIFLAFLRTGLEWMVRHDILEKSVRYNFGEEAALNLLPKVTLGETEDYDLPRLMGGISQVALAGGIHSSQWPKIWQKLRLPPANMEEWAADQEALREQREMQAEAARKALTAPQPTNTPPGTSRPNKPQTGPARGQSQDNNK